VLYPSAQRPELIMRAEFDAIWDGHVVSVGSPSFMQRVRDALADASICARGSARDARRADRGEIAGQAAQAGSANGGDSRSGCEPLVLKVSRLWAWPKNRAEPFICLLVFAP
jgi:hypothetical protein